MAAKPLEAAPGSQHPWGPSPKNSHWECEGCTSDVMAVTGSPGPSHRASLERTHPAPDLGPTHHLIASQSTVVRRGWRMDEIPALSSQKQARGKAVRKDAAAHQPAGSQTHHRSDPGRSPATPSVSGYLTVSAGYPNCLQQVLQKQPPSGLHCAQPCTNLQQANSADAAPRCRTAHSKHPTNAKGEGRRR